MSQAPNQAEAPTESPVEVACIKAHEAGYEHAFENGKFEDNPHKPGSSEHGAWDAGFEQALQTMKED